MTVVGTTAGWQEGLTACERTVAGVEVCRVGKAKRVSIESLDWVARWTSLDVSSALESDDPESGTGRTHHIRNYPRISGWGH